MRPLRCLLPALLPALALASAVAVIGCGGDDALPGNAVARLDGVDGANGLITKAEFDARLVATAKGMAQGETVAIPKPPQFTACIDAKAKGVIADAKASGAKKPAQPDRQGLREQCESEYDDLRTQTMSALINDAVVRAEAARRGVRVPAATVQREYDKQLKAAFPKKGDLADYLKRSGQTTADLRAQVETLLIGRGVSAKLAAGQKVTDAQIKAFYEKNRQRFATPARVTVSTVGTKTKASASRVAAGARRGEAMTRLSKRYSVTSKADNGGKPFPVAKQGLPSQLTRIFTAKRGSVIGPVKIADLYYVVRVGSKKKAATASLSEVKAQIRQQLATERAQKAQTAVFAYWKKRTDCRSGYAVEGCRNAPKPQTSQPTGSPQTPVPGAAPNTGSVDGGNATP